MTVDGNTLGIAAQTGRVLVVTYVFAPSGWVGVHRTLKYCKYLGTHGWIPVVLTANTRNAEFVDERLLAQVPPGTRIHRTFDFDPAKLEARLAQKKLRALRERPRELRENPVSEDAASAGSASLAARVKKTIKALLKESPDSHIFWLPFAVIRGVWILLTQNVDVVYSTSPPHSTHMVAYVLAKLFRKAHVVDFRDPWYVMGSIKEPSDKPEWIRRWETRVKRAIVEHAAHVICVSNGERNELLSEVSSLDPNKVTCITNGFDPDDFDAVPPSTRTDKLTLIHAGTIYPGIAAEFLEALGRLNARGQSLEVRLVGDIDYGYTDQIRQLEEAGVIVTYGLRPHGETLALMAESDVLVILMGGTYHRSSHLPSKMFEYLHAGKPIFVIAREGELTEVARKSGLGIVVSPDDVEGIVEALRSLIELHQTDKLMRPPNRSFIDAFQRSALARKLADVLTHVAEHQRRA